jgi:hypothetical protein
MVELAVQTIWAGGKLEVTQSKDPSRTLRWRDPSHTIVSIRGNYQQPRLERAIHGWVKRCGADYPGQQLSTPRLRTMRLHAGRAKPRLRRRMMYMRLAAAAAYAEPQPSLSRIGR